ncbi:hypothetical protein PQJ75_22485 [Rhodoplanes sp. TEM]|uniref:Uncharacterized protein n=1 Tax=Rhodoplanes tepidamans TaxID=200616 RepID=A0ABT5JKD1_RHOTP|nr:MULTISPECIES: hypothetical protein [Rhodoplanes]MDC7790046.1 hypothetical protein [Rhodoplanes tepidamans]MDC7986505.1 hypothetical protein [Rhodoplanes sp. TEM]MDQ0355124.1 hypothetical protein [Rhodoplanes tepidamans]
MRDFARRYGTALVETITRNPVRSNAVERMNSLVGATFAVLFAGLAATTVVEAGSWLAQALCLPLAAVTAMLTLLIVLELAAAIRRVT